MKKFVLWLSCIFIMAACSSEGGTSNEEPILTKEYIEENAKIGLTYDEAREIFGTEDLSDVVDSTETWLYDSTRHSDYEYTQSLEVIASEEIKSGELDYQLFLNFMDEKVFMYSYFYKGEDGKVWQYQLTPQNEPLTTPVSN